METHRKAGKGPGSGERISYQAELLASARHPGVVELVGVEGSADRPVLVTVLVDGATLAAPLPLTVGEVAGLAGALASTLADLHDLDIVHGAVAPEHVLVAADGRPVLCGFGSAGRIGEVGPDGDRGLHPSTDVAAFGRLLRRLATGPDARALRRIAEAATADDPASRPTAAVLAAELATAVPGARLPARSVGTALGGEPVHDLRALVAGARPDRGRFGLRRRRSAASVGQPPAGDVTRPRRQAGSPGLLGAYRASGEAGPSFLIGTEVADWDTPFRDGPDEADPPVPDDDGFASGGPVAARLDRRDSGGAPAAHRPRPAHGPGGRRRRPVRYGAVAGAIGAVGAVALVVLAPWASSGQAAHPAMIPAAGTPTTVAASASTRPSVTPTAVAPTPSAPPATVRADCQAPTSVLVADIDGDGCLDALNYADGVLQAGGMRWALGLAGDQVVTGDWACRGTRTIVLLRPSTGEVFGFDGWAVGARESVTGAMVATVPGGKAVRAADVDHDGCHELVVERGELPPQVVRLPRPRS